MLRVGGWRVTVGRGYKLSVGGSRLMSEGWMFIGRSVKAASLAGRVLDSSGSGIPRFCHFSRILLFSGAQGRLQVA